MTHTTQQESSNSYLDDFVEVEPRVLSLNSTVTNPPRRYPRSFHPALKEAIRVWESKPFGALVFEADDCYGYIHFHGKLLAKIHKATRTVVQINLPSEHTNLARFHLRQLFVHVVKKNRKEYLYLKGAEKLEILLDKNVYIWPEMTGTISDAKGGPLQLSLSLGSMLISAFTSASAGRLLVGSSSDNGAIRFQISGSNQSSWLTFDEVTVSSF